MNSVTRQKKITSGLEQNTFFCQHGRKEYKIDLNYVRVPCLGPPCCFHQVEVHHFNRPKISNNSLIRNQKSNKQIAIGYKKLVHTFKREAVNFCCKKPCRKSLTLTESLSLKFKSFKSLVQGQGICQSILQQCLLRLSASLQSAFVAHR